MYYTAMHCTRLYTNALSTIALHQTIHHNIFGLSAALSLGQGCSRGWEVEKPTEDLDLVQKRRCWAKRATRGRETGSRIEPIVSTTGTGPPLRDRERRPQPYPSEVHGDWSKMLETDGGHQWRTEAAKKQQNFPFCNYYDSALCMYVYIYVLGHRQMASLVKRCIYT